LLALKNNHTFQYQNLNKKTLAAMISCHVAGLFFLPLMPLLFGAISNDFNVSPIQLGTIGTIQLSCTAVGAILLSKLASVFNCRTLVLFAIIVELIVNLATAMTDSISSVILLRAISGLSQGVLLASAAAVSAKSGNPERIYSLYNSMLAVFAVLALSFGVGIIEQYGHVGGFLIIAAIDLLALVIIFTGFPQFFIRAKLVKSTIQNSTSSSLIFRPMLALALFGAALSGTQTFIERLGVLHGGSIVGIGQSLSAGWCLSIVAPFFVVPLIRKFGGMKPLIGAYIFVALVAFVLSLTSSLSLYLIAAALFTPSALFIESLQFGILGSIDNSGKLSALGPAAISIGSGVGPILAGSFVAVYGLKSIGVLACIFFLVSIFVLFSLAVKTYKKNIVKSHF